jgi:hypothetical protein
VKINGDLTESRADYCNVQSSHLNRDDVYKGDKVGANRHTALCKKLVYTNRLLNDNYEC